MAVAVVLLERKLRVCVNFLSEVTKETTEKLWNCNAIDSDQYHEVSRVLQESLIMLNKMVSRIKDIQHDISELPEKVLDSPGELFEVIELATKAEIDAELVIYRVEGKLLHLAELQKLKGRESEERMVTENTLESKVNTNDNVPSSSADHVSSSLPVDGPPGPTVAMTDIVAEVCIAPASTMEFIDLTEESAVVKTEENTAVEMEESAAVEIEESAAVEIEESVAIEIEESAAVKTEESAAVEIEETAVEIEESVAIEIEESAVVKTEESAAVETYTFEDDNEPNAVAEVSIASAVEVSKSSLYISRTGKTPPAKIVWKTVNRESATMGQKCPWCAEVFIHATQTNRHVLRHREELQIERMPDFEVPKVGDYRCRYECATKPVNDFEIRLHVAREHRYGDDVTFNHTTSGCKFRCPKVYEDAKKRASHEWKVHQGPRIFADKRKPRTAWVARNKDNKDELKRWPSQRTRSRGYPGYFPSDKNIFSASFGRQS